MIVRIVKRTRIFRIVNMMVRICTKIFRIDTRMVSVISKIVTRVVLIFSMSVSIINSVVRIVTRRVRTVTKMVKIHHSDQDDQDSHKNGLDEQGLADLGCFAFLFSFF